MDLSPPEDPPAATACGWWWRRHIGADMLDAIGKRQGDAGEDRPERAPFSARIVALVRRRAAAQPGDQRHRLPGPANQTLRWLEWTRRGQPSRRADQRVQERPVMQPARSQTQPPDWLPRTGDGRCAEDD